MNRAAEYGLEFASALCAVLDDRLAGGIAMSKQRRVKHVSHLTASEARMDPPPLFDDPRYCAAGKLSGRRALITGRDSRLGRAVAIAFAKTGAGVAIDYSKNDRDARVTREAVDRYGRRCFAFKSDISKELTARNLVNSAAKALGGLDILVNNAGIQFPHEDFSRIKMAQMEQTFRTNIFAMFYCTHAALKYFKDGSVVINTASVTAFRGSEHLVDYSSTKGAIVVFTRSLALALAEKKIRVNAVAPGPIWTPLIQATFDERKKAKFGKDTALGRPGQPAEVAPSYVFLASNDSSYITGQVIHPNRS